MLVNIGEPIYLRGDSGYQFVNGLVPTAQGGFTLFRYSSKYDPSTGVSTPTQYSQNFSASAVSIGGSLDLGAARIGNVHAISDGSFLASIDETSYRFDDTGAHIDSKITLSSINASGKFTSYYTTSLAQVDDSNISFRTDVGIAYGNTGTVALVRIADGTKDGDNDRVVDFIDANHRFKATVVIDRDMTGDIQGSTKVTALSDGRYLMTWAESDATGTDVMARVITAAGKVSGAAFLLGHADNLSTPSDVKVQYSTTSLLDGNFAFSFQAYENYIDNNGSGTSEHVQTPLASSIWISGTKGFTRGSEFTQPAETTSSTFDSMITLSDGNILQVISDYQKLSDGLSLVSLRGYLYDENGKSVGDVFEFASDVETPYSYGDGGYAVALNDGNFAIVKDYYVYGQNGTTSQNIVQMYSTSGDEYHAVLGATAGDNTLKGAASSARSDIINGLEGNDKLYGYAGNDKLLGGNGNDLLDGGKGADRMEGGAGDDTYVIDNMGDVIVEGRAKGIDFAKASVNYTADNNVDNIILTGSNDLHAFGNSLANTLVGNAGVNVLYGLGGNDVLSGGLKSDILNGGAGKDTFVFDAKLGPQNVDRIGDFVAADDTIKLDDAIFKGIATGTLKAALFKDVTSSAVDANDRILYDHNTGQVAYDADGNGAVKAVVFAILDTHPLLTASDFLIV